MSTFCVLADKKEGEKIKPRGARQPHSGFPATPLGDGGKEIKLYSTGGRKGGKEAGQVFFLRAIHWGKDFSRALSKGPTVSQRPKKEFRPKGKAQSQPSSG
eukprot:RCo048019